MKKALVLIALLLLFACATEPQVPQTQPMIEKIEIIPSTLPEKPQYEPPPSAPAEASAVEITMQAKMMEFLPSEVKVNKGEKVKLIITSQDVTHRFIMPGYDINKELKQGEDVIVEFTADKEGTFTFYCDVPGHEKMRGKLIVT